MKLFHASKCSQCHWVSKLNDKLGWYVCVNCEDTLMLEAVEYITFVEYLQQKEWRSFMMKKHGDIKEIEKRLAEWKIEVIL